MQRMRVLALLVLSVAVVGCAATGGSRTPPPRAPGAAADSAGSATAAAPAALVPLRLGLNTVTANIAPLWVAKEEGFFAKHGIDVELVPIAGGERVVSALLS